MTAQDNQKIIETIIEMIKRGESEETIKETLKSLGLSGDEIKSLLTIAKKGVYEIILKDLNHVVDEKLESFKDEIINKTIDDARYFLDQTLDEIKIKLDRELDKMEETKKELSKKIDVLETLVSELKLRVDKLEYQGGGLKSIERRIFSVVLMAFGIILIAFGMFSYFLSPDMLDLKEIIKGLAILITGSIVILGGVYIK